MCVCCVSVLCVLSCEHSVCVVVNVLYMLFCESCVCVCRCVRDLCVMCHVVIFSRGKQPVVVMATWSVPARGGQILLGWGGMGIVVMWCVTKN